MFRCLNVWAYRHLIFHKAWADFRAESRRNYLGVFWWVIDPIFNTLIYYLVFGLFLQRGGGDYVPYLITGIVGWQWFFAAVNSSSVSIWVSAPLVRRVALKKIIFPLSKIIMSTYKFGFALLVLWVALLSYGYHPDSFWFLALAPMVVQLLLITACGLILAAIIPFVPDVASSVPYILRLGFFFSCVMYRLEKMPEQAQVYLRLNPMVHILNSYRSVFMYGRHPDWPLLAGLAALGLGGSILGAALIYRFDGAYAKRIVR